MSNKMKITIADEAKPVEQVSKQDYEIAVDAFLAADAAYEELEKFITEGYAVRDIVLNCGGDSNRAATEWATIWGRLATLLEERNARRKSAADSLRQAVVLTESQWKGPDGKPVSLQYDKFTVTSKTKRSFHAQDLLNGVAKRGLLESLLALKGVDRNGKPYALVEQQWKIDFEGVKNWLKTNGMEDVLQGAYDEKDDTPAVTGPKELYFLGESKRSGD